MVNVNIPNKTLNLVMSNKQESETWLRSSGYYDEWTAWHDLYRGIPKAKPYDWMSNKFMPLTMSKVETALSQLQGVLFSANPFFEVRARENSDIEQARLVQRLLAYQFDEMGFNFEFIQYLRNLCIYGTSFGKLVWDTKFEPKVKWEKQFEPVMDIEFGNIIGKKFLGEIPVEDKELVFRGPRFINCNISDIFPDPQSIDIQDGWVIHRTRRSRDYLLRMHELYPDIYNSEVRELRDTDSDETQWQGQDLEMHVGRLSQPAVSRVKKEGGIELLERWGLQEKKGKLVPWVSTVAAGKYLIRDTENPYWHKKVPFIKGHYLPVINSFYGIGIPEISEDLQTTINEIVNQRNDNISFALNKPVIYNKYASIDTKKLIFRPGGGYGADGDVDKVMKFIDIPNYTGDSFAHVSEMERYMQEVTGVTKLTLGTGGKDINETATGMALLQRASGERFMFIARQLESKVLKETLKMMYQLGYQYIEQDEMVRIIGIDGNKWIKVAPEDIRKNYDFVPAGIFTMENKMQKSLRLIQFYNIVKGNPMLHESTIMKKLYYALEIGENHEELLRADAEVQEILKLARTMAMGMVQGSTGVQPFGGIPGMGPTPPGAISGDTMPGIPGVPPTGPAVPPGERI